MYGMSLSRSTRSTQICTTRSSTTGGPNQSYSVKSGDNLSKISNRFYGSPNHYSNIAAASNISDPNKIQVGQQITVPVLS